MNAVGIDVGGTQIKGGIVREDGTILRFRNVPTPREGGEAVLEALVDLIRSLLGDGEEVAFVGVGVPGWVDGRSGVVGHAPNLKWRNVPLRERLARELPFPVAVENDANVALLGELWRGAARGAEWVLFFALGTGVGGAILAEGKLLRGARGFAGEFGHIPVRREGGLLCSCGKRGCLETEASGRAIARRGREAAETGRSPYLAEVLAREGRISARHVATAASEGDAAAREIFVQAAEALAFVAGGLVNALNPERIVVGGGVSRAGEVLFTPLREALPRYALPEFLLPDILLPGEHPEDAGVLGAAYLGFREGREAKGL
ncbi:MAG: Glucokinase [Brockia lithotrophica]|uniref:Glucokinase n=1 Tax=Brockia lithotrophica TaxID=933949 RepID=A0A2T5GB24_9BACL|nr:ROK family protein [Brockia lithotrophica]PTQ53362.1 MAG: Glucokinase [Brockia lithotrophica]